MTRARTANSFRFVLGALLVLGGLSIGWLATRATALELLSSGSSTASVLIANEPESILGSTLGAYFANRATVPSKALPSVRRAAVEMPLDDRPYLLIGSEYLNAGKNDLATRTLEAGRRLDPRQRWIHLLLVYQYLRAEHYTAVAEEFSVLSRLVGAAQGPIATVLAQMSVAPETRDAVRETLRRDQTLERSVLTSLASGGVEPAVILAMASPAAFSAASGPGNWGTVLVNRLVEQQRYRLARSIWQKVNHLTDQQVQQALYDANFDGLPGQPPFNWKIESGDVAAVDLRSNGVQISYYGRNPGDLLSQLLLLPPGRYRLSHIAIGSQQATGSTLGWSVECADQPRRNFAHALIPVTNSAPRRISLFFTVPENCAAQQLHLTASPGEFPVPISVTVGRLQLEKVSGK